MSKDIATISRTLEIIQKHGFHFKKGFGQNFLVDLNILNKIVEQGELTKDTYVIEIGPGIGSLTEQLAKKAKQVICYEIDKALIPILSETLQEYDNVKIINEDVLKADVKGMIETELKDATDIALVANLPYYITTPILMNLLGQKLRINRYLVMVQKEVAQRLSSTPDTKDYNALSVLIQYYTEPKIILHVPRTVFIPQPKVDSAVLRLKVREKPLVEVEDEELFFRVVKGSFIQRRKTIFNNLKQAFTELSSELILEALQKANINFQTRGEALTIYDFARLSNIINYMIHL